ncbi:Aste57867_9747 [Aphanomyces stellatus]|uniref:Aste57867_9747 protein n=1 Tax=Aphanomyces stellatus TaxID=120398 RepID=A0A485KNN7_9STRA|nr:hypothetical protein As57867_009708 [Aphanomyces stellatus]VFT86626.1 Aste57867_9747 [Aphanomyces stellatus]
MLDASNLTSTPRPILLILDGCSSHYSNYIYDEAQRLKIHLLFLPSNSTHLFQPLDVTVFRPFKQAIRREVMEEMWSDTTSVDKKNAISIACRVWEAMTKRSAIINCFECTGLFPPSVEKMIYRLSIFKSSDDINIEIDRTWMERFDAV